MKKLRFLVAVVFAFVLTACATNTANTSSTTSEKETSWAKIEKAGVLKVATPGTLFPTSYHDKDQKLIGYEIDMLNEMAKRLNIKIEYTELGVDAMFTAVDNGQVDIAVNNFDITKARKEKYNFSVPYKYSIGGVIVREDGSSAIEKADLSDWTSKKAGGGATTQYMKIAKKLGAEPVVYDNVTNDVYLRDVSTGRTDFIPNDYFTQVIAVKWVQQNFPDIKVKVSETVRYNPTEQAIVMSKADTSVQEKLNGVLEDMKKDGSLKAISEKYYAGQDLTKALDGADKYPVINVD